MQTDPRPGSPRASRAQQDSTVVTSYKLAYRTDLQGVLKLVQEEAVGPETGMRFGTRTQSSIKSTSAPSTTATGMASAIFKGLTRSSTTSGTWGSALYGSCHSFPRLCATMATTSRITTRYMPATEL